MGKSTKKNYNIPAVKLIIAYAILWNSITAIFKMTCFGKVLLNYNGKVAAAGEILTAFLLLGRNYKGLTFLSGFSPERFDSIGIPIIKTLREKNPKGTWTALNLTIPFGSYGH